MPSDIQIGDLVICVSAPFCTVDPGHPESTAAVGRVGRVLDIYPDAGEFTTTADVAIISPDPEYEYCSGCLRKLNDELDNAELIAKIRACKPMKQPVSTLSVGGGR